VTVAAVIQAKDVVAVALNKKRKETTEIRNLDKVRVCFTLRENPIAEAGNKIVYLRVLRPDQLVITPSPDNLFEVKGEQLIFSATGPLIMQMLILKCVSSLIIRETSLPEHTMSNCISTVRKSATVLLC